MSYGESVNVVMDELVRSAYVAAYFREHMLMTATEMEHARGGLLTLAASHGLDIDAIFVEHLESAPAAFAAMIDKLQAASSKVLIVPGVHHLAGLGNNPLQVIAALKDDGVQVIFARHAD